MRCCNDNIWTDKTSATEVHVVILKRGDVWISSLGRLKKFWIHRVKYKLILDIYIEQIKLQIEAAMYT